jgi:hypothetical protein
MKAVYKITPVHQLIARHRMILTQPVGPLIAKRGQRFRVRASMD